MTCLVTQPHYDTFNTAFLYRYAVESRPSGISLFEARKSFLKSVNPVGQVKSADQVKIVCYYGGWAVYRKAPATFNVTDIDPFACTHVIYSFAGLDEDSNMIKSLDPEVDIKEGEIPNPPTYPCDFV